MSPPPHQQKNPSPDEFLDEMEQRLVTLKMGKSTPGTPPPNSASTMMDLESTSTPKSGSGVSTESALSTDPGDKLPFIKRPDLPREPFFVQLKGFSLIGDIAYFTMIEEGWWSLYAFVMRFIRSEYEGGRLKPPTEIIPGRHVVVRDDRKRTNQFMRCVIMGGGVEDRKPGTMVDVRDVDVAVDLKVPVSWLYEMPEEGLSVPFMALKVVIDKTQVFLGTDIVFRAFAEAQLSTFAVFKAIQVRDRSTLLKKDTFTLEMYTPLKENLGDVLIRCLGSVCSVPVPQPSVAITVGVSHFTDAGEIYYQAIHHQRKLLETITDFDVIIRRELPSIMEANPDYSNEADVRMRMGENGHVLAAKYSEDGRYYRAEVLDVCDGDMVSVHFIDYGNDDYEVKLKDILLLDSFDEALTFIPRMCRRVKLRDFDHLDVGRMEAVLETYSRFKIQMVTTTPTCVAELWAIGKDGTGKEITKTLQEVLDEVELEG